MTVPPLQSLNHCAAFPAHRRMRQVPRRWVHISSALVLKSVFRHTTSRLRTTYSPGGSFEVHFAIGKIPRVRVLSGSPDLTNLGTGCASFGFHAREKSADYGSRVGYRWPAGATSYDAVVSVRNCSTIPRILVRKVESTRTTLPHCQGLASPKRIAPHGPRILGANPRRLHYSPVCILLV